MLVVDDRENDVIKHKIIAQMGEYASGGIVKIKRLKSADYIIGDVGIEAKEINDLYHSILGHGRSRTIVGQLHDLVENFERPMLVVYGTKLKPFIVGNRRPSRQEIAIEMKRMQAVIKKFKQHLYVKFPTIQFMQLGTMDEMVDWLHSMHDNMRVRRINTKEPKEYARKNVTADPRVAALSALEGISERAAHDLLTEFGSLPRILRSRTSQRQLMGIDGIGRKRAKTILRLRERYPDQPDRSQ